MCLTLPSCIGPYMYTNRKGQPLRVRKWSRRRRFGTNVHIFANCPSKKSLKILSRNVGPYFGSNFPRFTNLLPAFFTLFKPSQRFSALFNPFQHIFNTFSGHFLLIFNPLRRYQILNLFTTLSIFFTSFSHLLTSGENF